MITQEVDFKSSNEQNSFSDFLSAISLGLVQAGLDFSIFTDLEYAIYFEQLHLHFPSPISYYLDKSDPDNIERGILFLSAVCRWKESTLTQKKKILRLMAMLFPSREEKKKRKHFYFEKDQTVDAGFFKGVFDPFFNLYFILYLYSEDICQDQHLLSLICADSNEEVCFKTGEGSLEWLYSKGKNLSLPDRVNFALKLEKKLVKHLRSDAIKKTRDSFGELVPEFYLNLKKGSDDYEFLISWLLEKGIISKEDELPLGSATTKNKGSNNIVYFYPPSDLTVEHERMHMESEGFEVEYLGDGLNEAMTELKAEEKYYLSKEYLLKLNFEIQNWFQDYLYFYYNGWLPINTFAHFFFGLLAFIPKRLNKGVITQIYEEEVALILKMFREYPDLRDAFEKRYLNKTADTVFNFSSQVINEIGIDGYLDLYLFSPQLFNDEENEFGQISAAKAGQNIFGKKK